MRLRTDDCSITGVMARATGRAITLACLALPGGVAAGGLYIQEFADTSMGTASAGGTALAIDASISAHNAAGMTRLSGTHASGGLGALFGNVEFDPAPDTPVAGGDGGDAGGFAPLMRGSFVHSVSDRLKLGVSLVSVSGAALDYKAGWAGRYQAEQVKLLTLSAMPSLAYKVTDRLSLSAGAMILYGQLDYRLKAPLPGPGGNEAAVNIDRAYGWDAGVMLGGLFEASERTRFGLIYQSEVEPDLDGDLNISPFSAVGEVDTRVPLVQRVRGDVYHEFNDRWAVLAGARWEDWSQFDNQWISTAAGTGALPRNWDDTWGVSVGVHYSPRPRLMLQLGVGYDSNPVSASDRTADMPIDEQWRIAAGARFEVNDSTSFGGAFTYLDLGSAKINSPTLRGDYENNRIVFFAAYMNKRF